ncbi:MAG: hypothetical protein ABI140_12550 [Jatrophihabitantaceae bacterium]
MLSRRISHLRNHTAARSLAASIGELDASLLSAAELKLTLTWAGRILEADDRHGSIAELVVQGDEVRWPSISGLLELASYGMLAHRQLAHDGGAGNGCPLCEQSIAMWHTALVDPITRAQQTTAVEMHDRQRRHFRRDLSSYRKR